MTSVVSPFVTSYATETPYITVAEFMNAPTAIDLTSLLPQGNTAVQEQVVADCISRASSWVNNICHQILACTVDIERGKYRVDRDGYLNIPLKYNPVLEVRGINFGPRPSQMQQLTDFTDVEVYQYTVRVPVWTVNLPYAISAISTMGVGQQVMCDVTYVNGFVASLTAAVAAQGATNLVLTSVLGIYPNCALNISDGVKSEQVIVAPSYVPGNTTVPLVSATVNEHDAGVSVHNLPSRVKEATILLTTATIQTRGDDAIVLDMMETPTKTSGQSGATSVAEELARTILGDLVRAK